MSKKNKKNNKVVTPPVVETKQEKSEVKDTNVQVDNVEQHAEQNADPGVKGIVVPPQLDLPLMPSTNVQANGLDPNHQVDLIRMTHEYYKKSPELIKKFNIPQEVVDNMGHINMIAIAAAWANEMTFSKTPFAAKMRTAVLPEMASALKELGIKADKILALPSSSDGTTTVTSKDVQIPKPVKDQMKAENKLQQEEIELDPTKIHNKTEVFKTVQYLLTNKGAVYSNIKAAVNFYRSWLLIQAKDDQAEKDRINARTVKDIILDIAEFTNACPFVLKGVGGYLLRLTMTHNSIVPAFCIMRNTVRDKVTGKTTCDEQEIADICYAVVNWAANARISEKKKNIEVLSADKKRNKEAIDGVNADIKAIEDVISMLNNPNSDFADNVLDNLKSDDATVVKHAQEAFGIIAKCYYPGTDLRKRYTNLADNVKQLAGIITNLFRDPMSPLSNFNITNLDQELIEVPKDEEKPAETTEKADESSEESKETSEANNPEKADESSQDSKESDETAEETPAEEPSKEEKKMTPKMSRKMKKAAKKLGLSRKK
jgi:hypothetical protein